MKNVRLWTIQDAAVWTALQSKGHLFVDPSLSETVRDWPDAINWMRSQMCLRTDGYTGHHPWWGWYARLPNLTGYLSDAAGSVMLELKVPDSRLLVSAFSAWEMVVGHGYVAFTKTEHAAWELLMSDHGIDDQNWPLPEPWARLVMLSWERIFDIPALKRGGCWSTSWVQAAFERLDIDNVISHQVIGA